MHMGCPHPGMQHPYMMPYMGLGMEYPHMGCPGPGMQYPFMGYPGPGMQQPYMGYPAPGMHHPPREVQRMVREMYEMLRCIYETEVGA